jgi:RimJ/RimL family protein N-acetyltransferase
MNPESFNAAVKKALESCVSDKIRLRLAHEDDAGFILGLRTDVTIGVHLSPVSPDLEAQRKWMRNYAERNERGHEHYFVIEEQGRPVGTIRMYDYNLVDRAFFWGSWVVGPGSSPACAIASVVKLYDLGFQTLGFLSARFRVRKDNASVLSFHRRVGAHEVGEEAGQLSFEITASHFASTVRPRLLKLGRMLP